MYRRTSKYTAERQRRAQATRDRKRLDGPAPAYPAELPELRMRITVERFDAGKPSLHVFELLRSRRIDQYRVVVDGTPWRVTGLAGVLEGLRKATPRLLSERASAVLF